MINSEMIAKILTLAGTDSVSVNVEQLDLQIEIIKQKIKNYCNREDIPTALELIIVDIVAGIYKRSVGASENEVESIKRGDTDIKFRESKTTDISGNFISDYKIQLEPFIIRGAKVKFI